MKNQQKNITQIEQRLNLLGKKLRQQLALPFNKQDNTLLLFLREEISKYQLLHKELLTIFPQQATSFNAKLQLYGQPEDKLAGKLVNKQQKELAIEIQGGLGDTLCITPSLQQLKQQFPALNIHLYCHPKARELFKHNPYIDQLYDHNTHPDKKRTRLSVYAAGTDIHYRHHSAYLLAGELGIHIPSPNAQLFLSEAEIKQAKQICQPLRTENKPSIITISAVSRVPDNQNWPIENWQQLIKQFPDVQFAQLGLPDEPTIDNTIDWRSNGKLRESIALLSQANAHIGMDTFWGHAASATNTNAVILFGGTHPSVFGYPNHIALYRHLDCSPCHHRLKSRPCPYNTECINLITVEQATTALRKLLKKQSAC